ncbi:MULTISPECIES: lysine-sensitive aspartokinase 3 [Pasteurellaceae]|uniref:Aspartokinase n=1 Tax=Pasteurella atlantica TaxID=2827233 RepID=A0AAW8CMG7_9PAST|nr:lysine-sensitive aspartokinase 3 [Pasteurella atlantica]MBR0573223.1 lysine-sensitive aspartokinase 3 [Pasteurella atlantica]MDP8039161.1 lysine-sensitive aspartokinase 3 [Pasteurella atlantica]MDP8041240.1 lysine-sensitive aspartokinase 3 [Pasteurella atlantica]MDP8043377.1 lysine-sensitive aspartokinase 3 [Pasteurella atlantica]MDP8045463.1 lysine-sensitive aspartokinase 3 [Pasteurella atlantica]
MPHLSVAKFGGTSVANFKAMSACANIITSDKNTRVIVLSASAGITDYLVELANGCKEDRLKTILNNIRDIQFSIINQLQCPNKILDKIELLLEHISNLAESATLVTSRILSDELISHGEMLSSTIFTQLLKEKNIDAIWVDIRDIVATNDNYGKALPNNKKTQQQANEILKPLLDSGKVIVTQGFIGRDDNGKTTTLGRGGSDYSAALLAEVLNANDVLIWTDVSGIYTMDPRVVPNAKRIETISFNEAAEMATFGAKVLHPATLLPAVRSNIPVFVGSSKNPEQGGTWITSNPQPRPIFRAIALRGDQTLVTLSSLGMIHTKGFLANIFSILAKHQLSIDVVTTSEISIALTLDKIGSTTSLSPQIIEELSISCNVQIEPNLALVTIIGNNLHTEKGLAKQLFGALEKDNIRLISYGASSNNICILVNNEEVDKIVRGLHCSLFEC